MTGDDTINLPTRVEALEYVTMAQVRTQTWTESANKAAVAKENIHGTIQTCGGGVLIIVPVLSLTGYLMIINIVIVVILQLKMSCLIMRDGSMTMDIVE